MAELKPLSPFSNSRPAIKTFVREFYNNGNKFGTLLKFNKQLRIIVKSAENSHIVVFNNQTRFCHHEFCFCARK